MITFKQFITEIFDGKTIYPWRSTYNTKEVENFKFDSFTTQISLTKLKSGRMRYGVDFNDDTFSSAYEQIHPTGLRSPKEAIKIYNTVGDIIKTKIIPRLKPGDEIIFTAVNPRTVKIYERFAKLTAKVVGGRYKERGSMTFVVTKE